MARLKPRTRSVNGKKETYAWCGVFYNPDRSPKEKSVSLRTASKQVARRRLTELERRHSLGEFDPWASKAPHYGLTISDAIQAYLKAREKELRPKSLRSDQSLLRNFEASVPPALALANVEERHVKHFLESKKTVGRSAQTLHTYATRLRVFFNWLVSNGYLKSDPSARLKKPKLGRMNRPGFAGDSIV